MQRKSLGVFLGVGREASSLLPASGLGAGPAGEVLVHFPMETKEGEETCLSG